MSNGVKTRLVKPTETAVLNHGDLLAPRFITEKAAWNSYRRHECGYQGRGLGKSIGPLVEVQYFSLAQEWTFRALFT
ncbi:hypothetical protein I79_014029 [Cricetulus griseus]|uniref:Uncharacterized protein n=1 Tax=Cricetulus griseus TaxID=10029 RepID=G3HT20_CRIGR|nr:hypothetical protein I79_014029 [Cricetulus griseus]